MSSPLPTVIVIGAGRGSRFRGGGHKLGRPWAGGTVFGHTVSRALASGLPVKVVTTEPLVPLVTPQVARRDIVVLPDAATSAELGMGYSISAGVKAALDSPGWLVLPADMPLVEPATIQTIAQSLRQRLVVYPQHGGRRGHPVGFSPELLRELTDLHGDEGARRVVARYPAHAVDVDDSGVLLDFDTEEDFSRFDALASSAAAAQGPSSEGPSPTGLTPLSAAL